MFLDLEKVDRVPNSDLPLIIVVVIIDLTITRLLVDDESSCNILYEDALESLSLHRTNRPSEKEDILSFKGSIIHPC